MIVRLFAATAALALGGAALAQTTAHVTTTTTTTSKPKLGANSVTQNSQSNVKATAVGNGHVATATTKTVHYDCSKAGNKNKAACKKA